MSDSSQMSSEVREITWGWWLAELMGAVAIAAGIIVVAKPSSSLTTLAVIFGIFIFIDGIAELLTALFDRTQNRGMLAVVGVMSVIAGTLLVRHPLGGVKAIALIMGIWLIAAGVVRLMVAFDSRGHRLWRVATALVLMIVGIAVVASPHIGYSTLALVTGIGFMAYGVGMLVYGWALHAVRHAATPSATPPPATPRASATT